MESNPLSQNRGHRQASDKPTNNLPPKANYPTKSSSYAAPMKPFKKGHGHPTPKPYAKNVPVPKYKEENVAAKSWATPNHVTPISRHHPRIRSTEKLPSLYPHKLIANQPRSQVSNPKYMNKIGGMYPTENGHISYWPSLYSVLFPPKYNAKKYPKPTTQKFTKPHKLPQGTRSDIKISKRISKENVKHYLSKKDPISPKPHVPYVPKHYLRNSSKQYSSGEQVHRNPIPQENSVLVPLSSSIVPDKANNANEPIPTVSQEFLTRSSSTLFLTSTPSSSISPATHTLIIPAHSPMAAASTIEFAESAIFPTTSSAVPPTLDSGIRRHPTAVRSPPFHGVRPSRVQIREPLSEADFNEQIFSIFRSMNISAFVLKTQDGSLRASTDPQKTWFIPLRHDAEEAEEKAAVQLHNVETDDLEVVVSGAKRDSSKPRHIPHITYTELEKIAPGMSRYYAKLTTE